MYIQTAVIVASSVLQAVPASFVHQRNAVNDLQEQATATLKNAATNQKETSRCNVFNAHVRKDWSACPQTVPTLGCVLTLRTRATMTASERKSYTKAVNCLMAKPSKLDPAAVPGAKSRYDDYVAQHINQTLSIHGTGNFLSRHRYFVWSYEMALKEECHYQGYQPVSHDSSHF